MLLKWESRFTVRLTLPSTNYIEKCFKQKLSKMKFFTEIQWMNISIALGSGGTELQTFVII